MAIAAEELAGGAEAGAGREAVDARIAAARARMPKSSDWRSHKTTRRKQPAMTSEQRKTARAYNASGGKTISEGRYRAEKVAGGAARAAKGVASGVGSIRLPNPGGSTLTRVIFAFGAGLLALELASYVTGRYFTWNLKAGATKLQKAANVVELYPGQAAKLAPILNPAPPKIASATGAYSGTSTLI